MTPRILLADDNPEIRELMAAILNEIGCSVTLAEDGLVAWDEVGRNRPNLVVLDIEMPRLNGDVVCRRIKSQPETRGIPVLLVSGGLEAAQRARCAGADGFLNKPFLHDDLRVQVDLLLGQNATSETDRAAA